MRPSCFFALLIALASTLDLRASPQDADGFVLAIVRDDGLLRPVATHKDGRWRTPWPEPAKEVEVPVRLTDCPLAWWGLSSPPRGWTLHEAGQPPRPLSIDGVTWVLAYCQQQVMITSRAAVREPLRQADGMKAPKRGVAASQGASLTIPRQLPTESPAARALLDHLQPIFNNEERLMLAGDYFGRYAPSVPERQRNRMPVEAITLHEAAGRDGRTVYYLELARRYPRRQPQELQWCDEVTYMAGWAYARDNGELELSLVSNTVTSCLLDTVVRTAPLAVVETRDGPVWLLEEHTARAEAYSLYRAPGRFGAELIRRTSGGSCLASD